MRDDQGNGEGLPPGEPGTGGAPAAPGRPGAWPPAPGAPGPGELPGSAPGPGGPSFTWGYASPPQHLPPPGPRPARLRGLLAYLVVAVVAAAAGAGITGYALRGAAAPGSSASGPAQGGGPGFPGGQVPGGGARGGVPGSVMRAVVSAVRPGLVDISSNLGYQGTQAAATGMIISRNGLVLTNNHVITDTTQLYATLVSTGQHFRAKWLGYDAVDDVAVIKLIGARDLRTVPIGNSATVRLGERVIALGNANGAGGAPATAGTVTGLNRTITASDSGVATSETLHGMIETNAGIVRGDSGGPLVDTAGRVIGMDTAAVTGQIGFGAENQGYAIPINKALRIADQIIAGRPGPRVQIGSTGFMGVLVPADGASRATSPRRQRQLQLQQDQASSAFPVQPSTPVCLANDLNAGIPARVAPVSSGALIIGELCGTPADRAGIVAGDVITAVGGKRVTSPAQLTTVMHGFKPGMTVTVTWADVNGQIHRSRLVLIQAPPH